MQEYELTQQDVSEIIGKSRSAIANTVRILNLDDKVLELVKQGKLTEGHCRTLLPIENPEKQYAAAIRMIEQGTSVREAENRNKIKRQQKNKSDKYDAIYRDIEDSFQSFFGTKVQLNAGKKKGKIVIEYTSNDDLERILDLIK